MKDKDKIAKTIKHCLDNCKEPVDEVAKGCDVSKETLYRIINKKGYTIESLSRVCSYFGLKIELIGA